MIKIYIDSNVFVSYVMSDEKEHKDSKEFIDYILNNNLLKKKIYIFTSRFTGVEVASAIFRRTKNEDKARALLYKIQKPWSKRIYLLPKNPETKIKIDGFVSELIETALKFGTPFGDTIHANDLLKYEINYFVTWNVKHFSCMQNTIPVLKVKTPLEMLTDLKNPTTVKKIILSESIIIKDECEAKL